MEDKKIAPGTKVAKTSGYPFRGTVLAVFRKSDGRELAAVEIEPGPNAAGLVYLHPTSALSPQEKER